jgi:exodeoxyribonuclease VII large subunit
MRARVSATRLRLEKLSLSLSHLHPGAALRRRRELLERRTMELEQAARGSLKDLGERFLVARGRLEALSPLSVLSRGYAIATRSRDRAILKSPGDVKDGEKIDLARRKRTACRARPLAGPQGTARRAGGPTRYCSAISVVSF